ncbi:uncharacterized protein AMSG_04066 [Thecamonas trahens ATCC 50062]|uniref:Uncharacterized protein n=1 Tax=Thecamonas trahens ATCC 50062 TaxID=461836 RepID=A0A0L0D626_THETB|nr:hypothetical protein AMSG_04066 [Thecamonas trahens ATCC 50062]KNC47837.1 hypothetical protein AMSG_04066 [Thecamonas trahens ATCC 50062]|eukprot:XP_013759315.1 hypothetical protein AMSG_04066 [Thecamonas trahens ATCC 50062]
MAKVGFHRTGLRLEARGGSADEHGSRRRVGGDGGHGDAEARRDGEMEARRDGETEARGWPEDGAAESEDEGKVEEEVVGVGVLARQELPRYAQTTPQLVDAWMTGSMWTSFATPETGWYGYMLLGATAVGFVVAIYIIVLSKFMPVTGSPLVDYISQDHYYSVLIPYLAPVALVYVYFSWLSFKFYRHN